MQDEGALQAESAPRKACAWRYCMGIAPFPQSASGLSGSMAFLLGHVSSLTCYNA